MAFRNIIGALIVAAVACIALGAFAQQAKRQVGYQDTPMLPGNKWHVHDGTRPQPKAVDPGTASTPDKPGRAPADAIVLFDGTDLSKWSDGAGNASKWKLENGAMYPVKGSGMNVTREQFGDCQVHVEYQMPNPPRGIDQDRGNSGIFLMGQYEVQVLDNYQNETYADGYAGSVYGQTPPMVNACRKPGEWQTMDIVFTVPRFAADGKLLRPAYETVFHNGVCVQNHTELIGATVWRQLAKYTPHAPKGPLALQDHSHPVHFRNVWVREIKPSDEQ